MQKRYTIHVSLILAVEVIYSNVEFATVLLCAIILIFKIKTVKLEFRSTGIYFLPRKKAEINSYTFVYKLTNSLIRIPYN